jgi:hypothetical protein
MGFIYLYEIEQETSCNRFKWGRVGELRGRGAVGDLPMYNMHLLGIVKINSLIQRTYPNFEI